jgi:hypothetical protein
VVGLSEGALDRAKACAPTDAGIYCFLGDARELLYVGKATNLRTRLAQHAREAVGGPRGVRSQVLYQRVHDVRFESCASADDAAAREADVIVALRPPFNASLRLEGRWNYVVLTTAGGRPQLTLSRQPVGRPAQLFGCFPHLGPGASSLPGRACTGGYAALARMMSTTEAVPPTRSVSLFLSGASSRLLDHLAAPIESFLAPAFERDRVGALGFYRYGPQALRTRRARHGVRGGVVNQAQFTQMIEAELRTSIGDDIVIVPVDETAERFLGRRAQAWARG